MKKMIELVLATTYIRTDLRMINVRMVLQTLNGFMNKLCNLCDNFKKDYKLSLYE